MGYLAKRSLKIYIWINLWIIFELVFTTGLYCLEKSENENMTKIMKPLDGM